MARTKLSNAALVKYGYGQVEPNHLSAQRTAQIYAQLPAAEAIKVLENGQFVKYDYATGTVNKTCTTGEWMLVFNEVKVYRDHEADCDFAMKKEDYVARVYSPIGDINTEARVINVAGEDKEVKPYARDYSTTVNAYEHDITSTTTPFAVEYRDAQKLMPEGTTMVPRVFKTNVGDIFTTNTIDVELKDLTVGMPLYVGAEGYLVAEKADNSGDMVWQVVKIYTLADRQPAAKIMRIA